VIRLRSSPIGESVGDAGKSKPVEPSCRVVCRAAVDDLRVSDVAAARSRAGMGAGYASLLCPYLIVRARPVDSTPMSLVVKAPET
jgi:hypothetical protein